MARAHATFEIGATGWQATLRALDRPGELVSLYFTAGLREATLDLGDGELQSCAVTSTSFSDGERIFVLTGDEPLDQRRTCVARAIQ